MASLEEDRAQLSYELAVYKEQISLIRQETERISLTTVDLSNALSTLKNIKDEGKEKGVLVPVGGGTMLKATIADTSFLVPIGSGYVVEMERKEAIEEIEKRIEATKNAVERLGQEFEKITEKLRETSVALGRMESASELSSRVEENIREDYI